MGALFELLRMPQWVKNGFVLAPLFFGADLVSETAALHAIAAFAAFCLTSSAVYIFNDLCDVEADRHHFTKRSRPLPSARLTVPAVIITMIALLVGATGVTIVANLPLPFLAILGVYVATGASYSLGLKHVAVLELFIVSSGFVLRLLAGGVVISVEPSPWIIAATSTIALLLTVGKRRSEIKNGNDLKIKRKSLEYYNTAFLDAALAALAGATLVVYLLFCISDYATIRYGSFTLVTAIPVGMGVMRYLQLVILYNRGDDPTHLLLSDKMMIAVIIVFIAIFAALIYTR